MLTLCSIILHAIAYTPNRQLLGIFCLCKLTTESEYNFLNRAHTMNDPAYNNLTASPVERIVLTSTQYVLGDDFVNLTGVR